MPASRKLFPWFFGLVVVCAVVGLVARLVDISSRSTNAAHAASDAGTSR